MVRSGRVQATGLCAERGPGGVSARPTGRRPGPALTTVVERLVRERRVRFHAGTVERLVGRGRWTAVVWASADEPSRRPGWWPRHHDPVVR